MENEMNKLINSSDTVFCHLQQMYSRAHADSSLVLCEFSFFLLYFYFSTQHYAFQS